jgi:putative aldouronate transport system substrate-binding protein
MLREDWLERVGWRADNIRTTQDLHTVLTLFKNSNLNPGGQVFPFTANGTGLQNALLMWGISGDFYQKDGRVYYGPITPEFREAVTTLAQWYREGLIHPDYATQDARAGNANMLNNVSGFYWGETGGISVMYMATWQDTNPNARVVGIRTPTATRDGRHWTHSNDIIYNGVALAISRTNRFPVESVRFMDWGYSREGHLLQNLGPEGITYNLVNGRPVFTPFVTGNPAGLAIDEAIARHGLGSMQGPYLMDSDVREQRMLHYQWQRDSVDRWNTMTCLQMYRVTLNPDESRRFGAIMGDVNTRRNEMFDRFVMGREPITRLEDFQNELRRMGIEEALAIQQTALNRWNAR